MAEKLTPQQEMAVHNRGGKLLVSAAAGSGKTKVLVDRLMSYLLDPVNPANLDEFLIITYTKAAATELRAKIAAKLTERVAEPYILRIAGRTTMDAVASTSSSPVNILKIGSEKKNNATARTVEIITLQYKTTFIILGTRSYFLAPRL